ncbi:IS1182 family transposase [Actinoplanes sp. Pm04-4]|uniref:IS1182 family transposase n=1 Tax=Paractinoplanes pyxinae TaxID=2997416 RepID=A0ABT4BGQ7_9ACTN|nr:IS1182 family transposase [Actinoplanes pyxinae]MCY1145713.1 IS1182 family transposase [Actinoplanes pyxinae]
MALGRASQQLDLLDPISRFCGQALPPNSIFVFLHAHRDRLFPDGLFSDLFARTGRRSVPPSVVAVVMVLQRLEGLSDREAVDRFTFDARWRYAAGAGGWDIGRTGFAHTVLVDMRERLRRSDRPDRIFQVALAAASEAGLIGRRRVLDSTPLYDAVATMDTVTLIRSAIRGLLKAAGSDMAGPLRAVLTAGDDYASSAKPAVDWDDKAARDALIDSRARDGYALLSLLAGREGLGEPVTQAMHLLVTVLGQDLETDPDGLLRIARKVATDRVISTVDPQARHGHKTSHRGFDGYKAHIAIDPDSEIITATGVTAGNTGDAQPVPELIADLAQPAAAGGEGDAAVYGDSAYGAGEVLAHLHEQDIDIKTKVQPPNAPAGKFTKELFIIDLGTTTVTCPNGITIAIRPVTGHARHAGKADFGKACTACPLREQCTASKTGRQITISRWETHLTAARTRQQDPVWQADYRATRPKVERKLAHLMRRRHGGRRARMRGRDRINADFTLLAAATNLARLATLGLTTGWTLNL